MPFGFVTKRQLDQLREDLARDLHAGKAWQEEMAYEWAKWYNKFRALYAMLLKREKSAADSTPDNAGSEAETPEGEPPAALRFKSRRGW